MNIPFLLILALVLLLVGAAALALGSRARQDSGLPEGRVIYADPGAWFPLEKPLYDSLNGLTGKPDYLVNQDGRIVPVEVKSTWAPPAPYEGHLMQLAAYCLLVERVIGKRPQVGMIKYRNRVLEIEYTRDLENRLLAQLKEIRVQEREGEADRSHNDPGRCARCGYRSQCEQRL